MFINKLLNKEAGMKKSLINDYLKSLSIILNDNRVSFAITGNFADKCHIVAYLCNNQVLHDFTLFNDSSIINYDNLVDDYLAIMAKHPTKVSIHAPVWGATIQMSI